jgi:maleate cis-trans isomerase
MEKEKTHSTKLTQFPSAEFIGIYYRSLRNEKEKEEFLLTMERYGASIARLFSQYGVNMIL